MKRTAIFAHYDQNNVIDDYVVEYLQALRPLCDEIIFVSDSDLPKSEIAKINVEKTVIGRHGEYDFGSYKRGFAELGEADQLVLCNDSCYLISDLAPVFETKGDFFGLIMNSEGYLPHLQSYFLVLNKPVFQSQQFRDFMSAVTKLKLKNEIIEKYEVGLTQCLIKAGFKPGSFIDETFLCNPTLNEDFFSKLLPKGFPLLKTYLLKTNSDAVINLNRWKNGLNTQSIAAIEKHVSRMIGDERSHWHLTLFQAWLSRKRSGLLNFLISARLKKGKLTIKIFKIPFLKIRISKKIQ